MGRGRLRDRLGLTGDPVAGGLERTAIVGTSGRRRAGHAAAGATARRWCVALQIERCSAGRSACAAPSVASLVVWWRGGRRRVSDLAWPGAESGAAGVVAASRVAGRSLLRSAGGGRTAGGCEADVRRGSGAWSRASDADRRHRALPRRSWDLLQSQNGRSPRPTSARASRQRRRLRDRALASPWRCGRGRSSTRHPASSQAGVSGDRAETLARRGRRALWRSRGPPPMPVACVSIRRPPAERTNCGAPLERPAGQSKADRLSAFTRRSPAA